MIEIDAYRYAIRNAYVHHGKADAGALIGKLKALYPDANPKELIPLCKQTVERVNAMRMNEISSEYERFEKAGFELHIPEKKVGLQDLEWAAEEKVITRYAPNPSAPPHLGHMRPAILSYLYAKKYQGIFILRFDDTDPKLKKPMADGEKIYLEDLKWLGIIPDKIVRASDGLENYYHYMRVLIDQGFAYVCTCEKDTWKKLIMQKQACICRNLSLNDQSKRFENMLNHTYKQGEALLRIKTELDLPDPAERDWWAAKIVDKPQHYLIKDKYVWPSYNFASAIDDHLIGTTLIIRGQQHTSNVKKQKWIYRYLEWKYPHCFHHGLIMMRGAELSKSKILAAIASGKYTGWDDSRLFMVRSLRKRGFQPQAFIDLMIDLGVKPNDTMLDQQLLATFNKPYVKDAPRLPFNIQKNEETDIPISVDMANGQWMKGFTTQIITQYQPNTIIHLEKIGFTRIDQQLPNETLLCFTQE